MINKLPPFVGRGIVPLPVIPTEYTDALSYGEQVGIMVHKLDETVDKVNEVVDDNNEFKADLTEQQNTFETNITNQQNTYEQNTTSELNTWKTNTETGLNIWKSETKGEYQTQINELENAFDELRNGIQFDLGIEDNFGNNDALAISQKCVTEMNDKLTTFHYIERPVEDIPNITKLANYSTNVANGNSVVFTVNNGFDTYYGYADNEIRIAINNNQISSGLYVALCRLTLPSTGIYDASASYGEGALAIDGTAGYRYRTIENNLPQMNTVLKFPKGTFYAITVTSGSSTRVMIEDYNYDVEGWYSLVLENNILTVHSDHVDCEFSKRQFNTQYNGLFELQKLDYNGDEVFSYENDFIGPLLVSGDNDYIGGKHGSETTTRYKVITDTGEIVNGSATITSSFTVFVESAIDTRFTRFSVYKFTKNKLTTESSIIPLATVTLRRLCGAGIMSCLDANTIAIINKKVETSDFETSNAPHQFTVVMNKGTLVSKETVMYHSVGIEQLVLQTYAQQNRKKFYYFLIYGTQEVGTSDIFFSTNELEFG